MVATSLPFAIWNMKGFIDTIPKELEEASYIDGATANQTFFRIMLPLALPGLAVTALLGFMAGWQEFVLSWQFISNPKWFTLSMALYGMQGQYAANTPWSQFAAMSILVSIPILIVFFALAEVHRRWLDVGRRQGLEPTRPGFCARVFRGVETWLFFLRSRMQRCPSAP